MAQAYWAEGIAGTAVFEAVFRKFPQGNENAYAAISTAGASRARDRKGCGVFPGGSGRS